MIDLMELWVGGARYGLPLERVIEVAPRVHIATLPGASAPLLGYLRYRGQALPAVDLRQRFQREAASGVLDEHIVIARARRRPVALIVDRAVGLLRIEARSIAPSPESADAVAGLVALEGGLLLIADLDAVLSLEEERAIDDMIARLQAS